jgi:hypothetical protein
VPVRCYVVCISRDFSLGITPGSVAKATLGPFHERPQSLAVPFLLVSGSLEGFSQPFLGHFRSQVIQFEVNARAGETHSSEDFAVPEERFDPCRTERELAAGETMSRNGLFLRAYAIEKVPINAAVAFVFRDRTRRHRLSVPDHVLTFARRVIH